MLICSYEVKRGCVNVFVEDRHQELGHRVRDSDNFT
jgi:hypothetical protein